MKYYAGSVPSRVKTLLENIEYLRDNKKDFIKQYRFYYPTDLSCEETLARDWRLVHQYEVNLRGKEWIDRQKSAKVTSNKFRNLGQIEDLSNMFSPIEDLKPRKTIFGFIRNLF